MKGVIVFSVGVLGFTLGALLKHIGMPDGLFLEITSGFMTIAGFMLIWVPKE